MGFAILLLIGAMTGTGGSYLTIADNTANVTATSKNYTDQEVKKVHKSMSEGFAETKCLILKIEKDRTLDKIIDLQEKELSSGSTDLIRESITRSQDKIRTLTEKLRPCP